jgi:phosphoribosyl-ATP pyrophosphohydrolase/phosphoribosyl-AMP cyclohydrolase
MSSPFISDDTLIPCVVQDYNTRCVLMVGYMNREAYEKTLTEKRVTFYSRSKQRLWTKGETSGNYLEVVKIQADCDNDTLLIMAKPTGPVCHTGTDTCFGSTNQKRMLDLLEEVIRNRQKNPQPGSYTSALFQQGINRIAQKVGEEAVELVIASKEDDEDRFLNEAADLLFHVLVLLAAKNKNLENVEQVLEYRHRR